ncbi:MAG: hypothetical protein ABI640_12640 [Gammaproteobacteria bacterium]
MRQSALSTPTRHSLSAFAEGQHALDELVRNCHDYLGVRFAALLMRDKGILIAHDSNGSDAAAMPARKRDALRTTLYDLVAQTKIDGSLVREIGEDPIPRRWSPRCSRWRGRRAAVPVRFAGRSAHLRRHATRSRQRHHVRGGRNTSASLPAAFTSTMATCGGGNVEPLPWGRWERT